MTKCNFHISLSPARVHKKFIQKLKATDYNTNFGDLLNKVDKLQVLIKESKKGSWSYKISDRFDKDRISRFNL